MKTLLSAISLIVVLTLSSSCNRCKDCTLTTTIKPTATTTQTTTTIREYCGDELKDIEDNSSYTRDDISYEWACE